ncbi:putative RNA methyltransferase [Spirochaetia bacterium]|nr:putative RNA methyltransferase [Spirochaetia bacterium]
MFTGKACGLASDGSAVVVVQYGAETGRKFRVFGAAPGDTVTITPDTTEKNVAQLTEIIEPSPNRTEPQCPNFGTCGGCTLSHITHETQIKEKSALLLGNLKHLGGLNTLPELKILSGSAFEYRNRVQFHKDTSMINEKPIKTRARALNLQKKQTITTGFMAGKGKNIIPVQDCLVCDPVIRSALQQNAVVFPPDSDRITVYGRAGQLLMETGNANGVQTFAGKNIRLNAGVFFQSNGEMLEILVKDLVEIAQTADKSMPAADFYSGVGTFSVFLSDLFPKIDLLEENKAAVSIARENISAEKACFYALTDNKWVNSKPSHKKYGFIVVDPARGGLSAAMCEWLCRQTAATICYVSCNPAALARDAAALLRAGRALSQLAYYDFYPQTAHIETLAVFH